LKNLAGPIFLPLGLSQRFRRKTAIRRFSFGEEIPASLHDFVAAAASAISAGESSKADNPALFFKSSTWPGSVRSFWPSPKIHARASARFEKSFFDDWTTGEPLAKADTPKFPTSTAGGLRDADPGWQIFDSSSQQCVEGLKYQCLIPLLCRLTHNDLLTIA
jgi:hypothetical protein